MGQLTRLFVISRVFFMVFLISGTALGETSSIETVTTANSVLPAAADDNVAQAIAQVQQRRAQQHHRGQHHVARAAHHGGQYVGQPDEQRTAEQHVRIHERGFKRRTAPAHGAKDAAPETEHDQHEQPGQQDREQQRLLRQAAGVLAAPGAQGPRHGGGGRAADTARQANRLARLRRQA